MLVKSCHTSVVKFYKQLNTWNMISFKLSIALLSRVHAIHVADI